MARPSLRFTFLRWHRRIGAGAAIFLLLISVTGLLLNHTNDLGLDRMPLQNAWLRAHYGLEPSEASAAVPHTLAGRPLTAKDGQLWLGDSRVSDCSHLVGVMSRREEVLVVCADRLVLLTPDGQLIDQADSLRGIPSGLSAYSEQGDTILLKTADTSLGVNLSDLSVKTVAAGPDVKWQGYAPAGNALVGDAAALAKTITWERVVQDLHSGRLFGKMGVWVVDILGIAAILLAASGLLLYFRRR